MAGYSAKDFSLKVDGTTVGNLADFDLGENKNDEVDVTTSGTEATVSGILRFGESKLTAFFDPVDAGWAAIKTLRGNGNTATWLASDPDLGDMFSFSGWVKALKFTAKRKDAYQVEITAKQTGDTTWL